MRPNYIFGPGDNTYRFPYWVERVARGGDVLGPPDPKVELQWVDVRDLCPWIVQLGERDQPGIYNASGPDMPVNWQQVLQSLSRLSDKPVQFRWATPEVLKETGIDLPLVDPGPVFLSEHYDGKKAEGVGTALPPACGHGKRDTRVVARADARAAGRSEAVADTGTGATGARAAQEALSHWDLIVVGVGAVGSAALRAASESGANVLGIELHTPAHARGSSHGLSRIFRHAYFEHPDYVPLLRHSTARFESLERESGARLLHRCGMLVMGDGGSETVRGSLASARRWNLPVDRAGCGGAALAFPLVRRCGRRHRSLRGERGHRPARSDRACGGGCRARARRGTARRLTRAEHRRRRGRRDGGDRRWPGAGSSRHRRGRRVDVAADSGTRAAADRDATGAGLVCPDHGHRRLGDALLAVRSRTRPARDLRPGTRSAGGQRHGRRALARPLSQGRAARVRRGRRSGHRRASGWRLRHRDDSRGIRRAGTDTDRRPGRGGHLPVHDVARREFPGRDAPRLHAAPISPPDSRATGSSSRPRWGMRSWTSRSAVARDLPVGFLAPDRFGTRG